jgi:hypothetical protein
MTNFDACAAAYKQHLPRCQYGNKEKVAVARERLKEYDSTLSPTVARKKLDTDCGKFKGAHRPTAEHTYFPT